MTLSRSFPIDSGFPNAVDLRRLDSGLVAREGVFPDPITTATAGIAVGSTAWNVQARPFVAALKRGGAPYSLSYGVARLANSAQVNAWEIQPAPVSGSRIDLLWIRATDPGEGESTSGSDGPGGFARAVPIFGVTAGTPSGTPATPALPAGALLIATVTTPSGAASIAGSTIVQSYNFAHLVGGAAYYRTAAALLADTANNVRGQDAIALDTGAEYRWSGSAWVATALSEVSADVSTFGSGVTPLTSTFRPRVVRLNNQVRLYGGVTISAGVSLSTNILTIPADFRPTSAGTRFIGTNITNGGIAYALQILTSGVVVLPSGYNSASIPTGAVLTTLGAWTID